MIDSTQINLYKLKKTDLGGLMKKEFVMFFLLSFLLFTSLLSQVSQESIEIKKTEDQTTISIPDKVGFENEFCIKTNGFQNYTVKIEYNDKIILNVNNPANNTITVKKGGVIFNCGIIFFPFKIFIFDSSNTKIYSSELIGSNTRSMLSPFFDAIVIKKSIEKRNNLYFWMIFNKYFNEDNDKFNKIRDIVNRIDSSFTLVDYDNIKNCSIPSQYNNPDLQKLVFLNISDAFVKNSEVEPYYSTIKSETIIDNFVVQSSDTSKPVSKSKVEELGAFVSKKVKQEVMYWFFDKYRKTLLESKVLKTAFPNSFECLENIDPNDFSNYLNTLYSSVKIDLIKMPDSLINLIEYLNSERKIINSYSLVAMQLFIKLMNESQRFTTPEKLVEKIPSFFSEIQIDIKDINKCFDEIKKLSEDLKIGDRWVFFLKGISFEEYIKDNGIINIFIALRSQEQPNDHFLNLDIENVIELIGLIRDLAETAMKFADKSNFQKYEDYLISIAKILKKTLEITKNKEVIEPILDYLEPTKLRKIIDLFDSFSRHDFGSGMVKVISLLKDLTDSYKVANSNLLSWDSLPKDSIIDDLKKIAGVDADDFKLKLGKLILSNWEKSKEFTKEFNKVLTDLFFDKFSTFAHASKTLILNADSFDAFLNNNDEFFKSDKRIRENLRKEFDSVFNQFDKIDKDDAVTAKNNVKEIIGKIELGEAVNIGITSAISTKFKKDFYHGFSILKNQRDKDIIQNLMVRLFLQDVIASAKKPYPILPTLFKYGNLMISIASAKSREEILSVFENASLPVGSSNIKKSQKFSVSINSYAGVYVGPEKFTSEEITPQTNTNNPSSTTILQSEQRTPFSLAPFAPIGIGFNWRLRFSKEYNPGPENSFSVFISIIDLGAIVRYHIFGSESRDGLPEISYENVFAPGVFLILGLKNHPFSVGGGIQFGPELTKIKDENTLIFTPTRIRIGVFFAIDLPLIHF